MDDDIYIREDKGGSEDDYEMTKAEVALEPEGSSRTSLEFEADDFVISVEKEVSPYIYTDVYDCHHNLSHLCSPIKGNTRQTQKTKTRGRTKATLTTR